MKPSDPNKAPRRAQTSFAPGTYLACSVCGRLLKIEWATRSIVCSCGARITPPPVEKASK